MKILYYNWVPFDDDENRGGGVTVYQRNLIAELLKKTDYEVFFISSGISYSLRKKEPYFVRTKNIFKKRCKTFQIVNSPILSPGHCAFDDMELYLYDLKLYQLFKNFVLKFGPFDVIHFNNFEGLSLNVLKIKEDFPDIKIIVSLHNYYLFCPQVNLWKREKENCLDFDDGKDCLQCLKFKPDKREVLFADRLAYFWKRHGINSESAIFRASYKYSNIIKRINKISKNFRKKTTLERRCYKICANDYKLFRERNVEYINKYADKVLCVSERVKEIAIKMGISPEILITDYIGTEIAKKQVDHGNAPLDSEIFTIVFMGYMRRDKGFFFLLKALNQINEDIAKNIKIIFAAKIDSEKTICKIYKLGKKYYEIDIRDGYSHNELPQILNETNLGIIPVLWEDNLPQVAIEMVAHGVPILASDLGGAHELCNDSNFIFKNNNINDFSEKLEFLFSNRNVLDQYWKNRRHLTTFTEHISKLKEYYS